MTGSQAIHDTTIVDGPPQDIVMPERVMTKVEQRQKGLELASRMLEVGSSLDAYVLLRQMREILETAEKQLAGDVREQCVGHTQSVGGALVQARLKAPKWDYHGDGRISRIEEDIRHLTDQLKAEQKMLQSITEEVPDMETGEARKPATRSPQEYTVAVTFPQGG